MEEAGSEADCPVTVADGMDGSSYNSKSVISLGTTT